MGMGDPTKKVQTGDSLIIPARAYNSFVDVTRDNAMRGRGMLQGDTPTGRNNSTILIRNDSGADRNQYEVLGIDGVVFDPGSDLVAFKNEPVAVVGNTPSTGTHEGKFVVLLEPIASGALGRAVVLGAVPVQVNVSNDSHDTAEIGSGVTANLISAAAGSTTILWREGGTGVQWALVRVGGGGGGGGGVAKNNTRAHLGEGLGNVMAIDTAGVTGWLRLFAYAKNAQMTGPDGVMATIHATYLNMDSTGIGITYPWGQALGDSNPHHLSTGFTYPIRNAGAANNGTKSIFWTFGTSNDDEQSELWLDPRREYTVNRTIGTNTMSSFGFSESLIDYLETNNSGRAFIYATVAGARPNDVWTIELWTATGGNGTLLCKTVFPANVFPIALPFKLAALADAAVTAGTHYANLIVNLPALMPTEYQVDLQTMDSETVIGAQFVAQILPGGGIYSDALTRIEGTL